MRFSSTRRQADGQILPIFAVTIIAIFIGLALVFDVGNLFIQRRMAQDAADAGALAGAQALVQGFSDTVIRDTIKSYTFGQVGPFGNAAVSTPNNHYLDANGADVGAIGSGLPSTAVGIHVEVTRTIPATFSNLIGIKTLTATGYASGAAGVGPVDIMMALDTTGSMDIPGFKAEQIAVHDFVAAMKLVKTDPINSVAIGLARFQGAVCHDNNPLGTDTYVQCTGTTGSPPPADEATILSKLTNDPDLLMTIACGSPSANCVNDYTPVACGTLLQLPLPLTDDGATTPLKIPPSTTVSPGTVEPYGCPLRYIGTGCCPAAATTPPAWTEKGGTKLANAFNVMQGTLTGHPSPTFWGWTDPVRPLAKDVLVMMTDGQDNSAGGASAPSDQIVAAAATLKTNAKGNVIIYTVGYYEGTESDIATYGSYPYPCPGPVFPPIIGGTARASATDQLMHDLSSSGTNDCQFYAPMKKSDDKLPATFLKIAGKIQAGRLIN